MATPRTLAPPQALAVAPQRLWDPLVRITHWALAGIVLGNTLVTEGGGLIHVALGWTAMGLLLLRLVWGVLGPAEARFSAFPPRPLAALAHLRRLARGRVEPTASHNPAGAMMVYAVWTLLAVIIATGLILTDGATPMQQARDQAAVASGDWSALIRGDGDKVSESDTAASHRIEEVHEMAANLLLILAVLHVAGVAVESRAMGRSLLRPMLIGPRRK
jgi:cytochrome b